MAKALTIKALENLKPTSRRREVPDGGVGGLYYVIQPSGKTSWAFRYRLAGRPRKLTLGADLDLKQARDKAREALCKIADGIDPGVEKKAARAAAMSHEDTVESVVAKFLTHHAKQKLKASTAKEIERLLGKELAPWSRRRLSEITTSDVHSLLDKIVERGSPVTANRTLAWLRRLCSWAKGRKIITANPCDDIEAPATEIARDRILTDDELLAVWRASEAIGNPYVGFIKLLILTGARRSEIAGMRWSEINIEKKLWTLPKERTKNKREHIVPLSDLAIDIIQHIPRIAGSDCVITFTGGPITGFYPVKNRLDELMPGVPHWTLHDLRRTFASGLARLGIAIHVVEALLNHRSGAISGIVAVYNRHDYAAEKMAAMATWSNYVSALVSDKTESKVHYITKV